MALLTACTAKNRVIESELLTTFTRDTVYPGDTALAVYGAKAPFAYYVYTRRRTMEYRYVGLTQAAAKAEAQRLSLAYRRECWKWIEDDETGLWTRPVKTSISGSIDEMPYYFVDAASVSATRSEGAAWEVAVSLDEEVYVPYRQNAATDDTARRIPPLPWTEFEANPDMETSVFRGYVGTDDADFGYYL